jgi:hypothetical protein
MWYKFIKGDLVLKKDEELTKEEIEAIKRTKDRIYLPEHLW